MTIYHMPLYKKLQELMRSGELGELRMVQMNFGSYKEYDMKNRFFNPDLAGGALLDIGVYALSFIRWFMSEKPDQVVSQVKFAPSGVDELAGTLLERWRQRRFPFIRSSQREEWSLLRKAILKFMNIRGQTGRW